MMKRWNGMWRTVFSMICITSGLLLAGCAGKQGAASVTGQETAAATTVISAETKAELTENATENATENTIEKTTERTAETEPAAKTTEESGQEPTEAKTNETYEDNFAVDAEAAKSFAEKIKKATADKDLNALAELTAFPVYVGLPDAGVVETKEAFLALGAKAVFTDGLVRSVAQADVEEMQPSMAGFSISGDNKANINFGVVDGVLAINGINYGE